MLNVAGIKKSHSTQKTPTLHIRRFRVDATFDKSVTLYQHKNTKSVHCVYEGRKYVQRTVNAYP